MECPPESPLLFQASSVPATFSAPTSSSSHNHLTMTPPPHIASQTGRSQLNAASNIHSGFPGQSSFPHQGKYTICQLTGHMGVLIHDLNI